MTHSDFSVLKSHQRIVLLTQDQSNPFVAKTAISLLRYRTGDIAAVLDSSVPAETADQLFGCGGTIPVIARLADAVDADSLYIGIAPPGGNLPLEWRSVILEALHRKMDVVSGLHDFLSEDPEFNTVASQSGAKLIDVRNSDHRTIAQCPPLRPGCLRIHAVGQDCSVGKMVVSLEINRGLNALGHDSEFIATGQTGIMITGSGLPIDRMIADFVNGAAESLVVQHQSHDFLIVEGQGSITHPAYSAVTLGLLHGCCPDGLIFCYEAGRKLVKGLDNVEIAPMARQLQAYEMLANLRHRCQLIGIAINTRNLTADESKREIESAEQAWGLPACDVYRTGPDKLVKACLGLRDRVGSPDQSCT